jgi:transcriptional regulator with XRE-family HTH domain
MQNEAAKFGVRIKAIRESKQISRKDVAARVGIQESYLEKIERGYNAPPSPDVITALAKALNTDADELFAGPAKSRQ